MFAYWKFLLTYFPNISDLTAESFTLFALNKTGAWLDAQTEADRNQIIMNAQKDVKLMRQKYKERREEILEARRENLERERLEKERKEKARVEESEKLCRKVEAHGGLWCSEEAVEEGLKKLTTGKRGDNKLQLEAIKDQINFRKKVLQQSFESPKVTSFSQGGVAFTLSEMIVKMKNIVAVSSS